MTTCEGALPAGVSPDSVRRQLECILASESFRGAEQLAGFLRYVVQEALAGRQDWLKQRAIAVHALGRENDFDPKADTIVRTSAHRLRSQLDEYYRQVGPSALVRIEIPKGQYGPLFRPLAETPAVARQASASGDEAGPPIAVWAFDEYGSGLEVFARVLADNVAVQLTRSRTYPVIGPVPRAGARRGSLLPEALARRLDARFVLHGSVCAGGNLVRVTARLFDARTGRNLWAETYRRDVSTAQPLAVADELAGRIAATIAGPWGEIPLQIEREAYDKSPAELSLHEAFACRNRWSEELAPAALRRTIRALEHAVQACPEQVRIKVWLAWAYLDDFAHSLGLVDRHFARVEELLAGARQREPSAEGEVRCMWARWHYLRREPKACLHEHKAALAAAPHDPWTKAVFASDACGVGDWERGLALFREVTASVPRYPAWLHLIPAMHHYFAREYEQAASEAARCRNNGLFWSPLCQAAALGHVGRGPEAAAELRHVLEAVPDFRLRAAEILRPILFSPKNIRAMLTGVQRAADQR